MEIREIDHGTGRKRNEREGTTRRKIKEHIFYSKHTYVRTHKKVLLFYCLLHL